MTYSPDDERSTFESDPLSPKVTSSISPDPADVIMFQPRSLREEMLRSEDWWAIWIGGLLLLIGFLAVWAASPLVGDGLARAGVVENSTETPAASAPPARKVVNPLKAWLSKPGTWGGTSETTTGETAPSFLSQLGNPGESLRSKGTSRIPGILVVWGVSSLLFAVAVGVMNRQSLAFIKGFGVVFLLATVAYVLAEQVYVKYYNLEFALWALAAGLLISNTVGTPAFVRPALRTELLIKTGLVLLGAEVMLSKLIALGLPGIFIAWVVTPIVLISTYIFGQRVLKMESRSLNMVISADMSVCGVSAAIATAAACRAKKEELSFAIGLSLAFTVVMMIVLPAVIKFLGLNPVVGGAWLGGTIDSTGAVAAAGGMLGDVALEVAATIKMIQNILIGVTAFGVAVYWVTFVERVDGDGSRPQLAEIWWRFPKFVLGFVAASIVFSAIYQNVTQGPEIVDAVVQGSTSVLRGWYFCLAFVSIGLETNFRELTRFLKGGKPLLLYVCGQSLNLILTLAMAWLMFEVVFRDVTAKLLSGQ